MNEQQASSTSETFPARGANLVERLADKLGAAASAKTVYGTPVERNGVTVIPVARLRYGFGGGAGRKHAGQEGSGGGGGVYARPVGYIEVRNNSAQFRPIRDLATLVPIVAVSGLLSVVTLRLVARLFRRR